MFATIHKGPGNGHRHWSVRIGNNIVFKDVPKQEARKHQSDINKHISIYIEQSGLRAVAEEVESAGARVKKAIGK